MNRQIFTSVLCACVSIEAVYMSKKKCGEGQLNNNRTGWYLSDLVFTGDSGFTLSRVEVKSMQMQHKAPKRLTD